MKKMTTLIFALLLGGSLYASEAKEEVVISASDLMVEDESNEEEANVEPLFEKVGFLTVEDCALKGTFSSCYTEAYVCGFEGCYKEVEPGVTKPVQLVLFVHDDGKYYKVELTDKLKKYELDTAIGRNKVTIIGKYNEDENTIYALTFKAPPPPKASFFKGCL